MLPARGSHPTEAPRFEDSIVATVRSRLHTAICPFAVSVVAIVALAIPAGSIASTITIRTVTVGSPDNTAVAIVPFNDAIYPNCAAAPAGSHDCQMVGGVDYSYRISQLEITVSQWVEFLNTADPTGIDRHDLYDATESSSRWPKYGQINKSSSARRGHHYRVSYPQWADKPFTFADFPRAARFNNSLFNGRVLSKKSETAGAFKIDSYEVRLSSIIDRGMYDLRRDRRTGATRAQKTGFVIPSQNEWIKAAYFDPKGGGTLSYWKYPTNPGVFGDNTATAPSSTTLDPANGNVTNAATQPVATFHATDIAAPTWCPSEIQPQAKCSSENPFGIPAPLYAMGYQGSVGSVGQARTTSPWGTLDQGGNAVEWTDTITPPPFGKQKIRVWRRLHGGIANAPAYQLWLSAIGPQPENNRFFKTTYPWIGIRIGFVGDIKVDGPETTGGGANPADGDNNGGNGGGNGNNGNGTNPLLG